MKTFKSKIGIGIAIVLALVFLVPIFLLSQSQEWPGVAILSGIFVFIFHLLTNTEYTIDGDKLHVRAGFLYRRIIDIGSITKVYETDNPMSSPAASLDRLGINYANGGSILVSPKDKQGFIAALKEVNSSIEVQLG
ncbi:MAG: PH domain-containing protein [Bacteroidia bacterium]|nr:PH domain-containing protein [Bacteroidia bacterium]MCF8426669.1 PH domain-containing protein [Bacteroidia bacterium]MCF8446724.1 PH domain-containing protein [Bacteroidia bacterium]